MKDDNGLISGIAIDQYASAQDENPEIGQEFVFLEGEVTDTPDVVRDTDPDQWGAETGVTETKEVPDDSALD